MLPGAENGSHDEDGGVGKQPAQSQRRGSRPAANVMSSDLTSRDAAPAPAPASASAAELPAPPVAPSLATAAGSATISPSLSEFVLAFSDGPACLVHVAPSERLSAAEASTTKLTFLARNTIFTEADLKEVRQDLTGKRKRRRKSNGSSESEPSVAHRPKKGENGANIAVSASASASQAIPSDTDTDEEEGRGWSFTPLSADCTLCLKQTRGKSKAKAGTAPRETSSNQRVPLPVAAPSTAALSPPRAASNATQSTSTAGTPRVAASTSSEDWLASWSELVVPGLSREKALAHIDLIRKVDWAATSLGTMDQWSSSLIATVGQCLGSPYPVLVAWGPDLTMIYNHSYGVNISDKHPSILGLPYRVGWSEVWEFLIPPTQAALAGRAVHAENVLMYLNRGTYLEECWYSWAMVPAYDDAGVIQGIVIPNFDTTNAMITERRIRFLQEASQTLTLDSSPRSFFRKICKTIEKQPDDIPLIVIYDCSGSGDERDFNIDEASEASYFAQRRWANSSSGGAASGDASSGGVASGGSETASGRTAGGKSQGPNSQGFLADSPQGGKAETSSRDRSKGEPTRAISSDEARRIGPASTFILAATAGVSEGSEIFPKQIPPPEDKPSTDQEKSDEATRLKTHSLFLKYFREVEETHREVVIGQEDMAELQPLLDKTALNDPIACLVIMPIMTVDDDLRAIAVIGTNPRKEYGDDYKVFLDLFRSQVSHGITSIRLVNEELRRSRFFAALIKRKNEELHQLLGARTDELKSSELKFVKMTEISPAGIWTAAPSGVITFANEAWWKISGHPRDRDPSTFLDSVHEDDKAICIKLWEDILESKSGIPPCEFRWKRQADDQLDRWCWAVSVPELDDSGNIIAITGVLTDITMKKQNELYQVKRAEEAIELRHAQERFIDMTSHELRNPLSAIILSADSSAERLEELVRAGAGSPPVGRVTPALPTASSSSLVPAARFQTEVEDTLQDLKIISHCCVHMTRLIDDVLTLSKLDNQFLIITPVPSRPVEFIRETLQIFKGEMQSKSIISEFTTSRAFVDLRVDYVLTDPSRVNQLLINLLTNAIKFTASSKVRKITVGLDVSETRPPLAGTTVAASGLDETTSPTSAVAIDQDAVWLVVSVSDSGRGLLPEEVSGLFQRFKQANPRTHISYGGSGLGLFICRRIAEQLGGAINVSSERGVGSTFTFCIPAKRCSAPFTSSADPSQSPDTVQKNSPMAQLSRAPVMSPEGVTRLPASDSPMIPSSPGIDTATAPLRDLHILVVEDNLVNQKLLQKHLSRMGCTVSVANHGEEALEIIKESQWVKADGSPISCILMDIEMPILDGIATIRIIRQMQAEQTIKGHLPTLAVTANARAEQIQTMELAGFDGTVSKPFKVPAIIARIQALLAGRSSGGPGLPVRSSGSSSPPAPRRQTA